MKKLILFLTLISNALLSKAQYDCFIPGAKQYFVNDAGYLRGMRIDSVRVSGTDTIYYPFHSMRGNYYNYSPTNHAPFDTSSGSWLGKKVIKYADGTYLFDNLKGDTAVIKTLASMGDSWTFFRDTSTRHYIATVMSVDTMTLANGMNDSVKTIVINAYNTSGNPINDSLNGDTILLSKTNGFVQVFDLYTFPYRLSQFDDFYYDKGGRGGFKNISFHDALETEIYDYAVNDDVEYNIMIQKDSYTEFTKINKVVKVVNVNPSYTEYILHWRRQTHSVIGSGTNETNYVKNGYDTLIAFKVPVIDTNKMPEESGLHYVYHYKPNDESQCKRSDLYGIQSDYTRWNGLIYDAWFVDNNYKKDVGLTNVDSGGPGPGSVECSLLFYDINGQTCGTYVPLEVEKQSIGEIKLFPNPANDKMYFVLPGSKKYQLAVIDITGKTVYEVIIEQNIVEINTANMLSGIYVLRITDEYGAVRNEKITVMH